VVLTHRLRPLQHDRHRRGMDARADRDRSLSWMPLTHDMGLIGLHLVPAMIAPTSA